MTCSYQKDLTKTTIHESYHQKQTIIALHWIRASKSRHKKWMQISKKHDFDSP